MTPTEAKSTWSNAAHAEKAGDRYVCCGNMQTLERHLRWFKTDDDCSIEVVSKEPVGSFTHVVLVKPNVTKERAAGKSGYVNPFLLLVS